MTLTPNPRINMASHNMVAAAWFSRRVGEIEGQHAGHPHGDWWLEILHNSSACILSLVASLEAYANELFVDREKTFLSYSPALLGTIWDGLERKSTFQKLDFALLLLNKPLLDTGRRPGQDVKMIIELRNALVHFKPKGDDEDNWHRNLSRTLNSRFQPSPFLTDTLLLPRRWATHGCTKWAVEQSLQFADEFRTSAGLPAKYDLKDQRYTA